MATRIIDRQDWQHYFDHLSSVMPTFMVEIEVAGLDIGDQIEGEWVPMTGISYDPKSDLLTVELDNGRGMHNIDKPQQVVVEEDDAGLLSIEVKCGHGHIHVLRLKTPLELPKG